MSQITPVEARETISRSTETDSNKVVARYELASCQAENYLLKQRMTECETSIQTLMQMVATIAEKQLVILGVVVEMYNNNASMPPKIHTVTVSTSTTEDGIFKNDYMPDADSDDSISPLASSESGSEPEHEVLEPYNLATRTGPSWSILYSIEEEIEPEEDEEVDEQEEPQINWALPD